MRKTILPMLFLFLLCRLASAQTEVALPIPRTGGDLRIVNGDGEEFTRADLETWVRLYVEGISGLTEQTTLGDLTTMVQGWALVVQCPPETNEDEVDYKISAGLLELKPPYEWRIILDVWAAVQGDYVVAMAMPGDPIPLATHRIRFGEVVPPKPDPVLSVSPSTPFSSSGPPGGPFEPPKQVYIVSNEGKGTLQWAAQSTQPWITAVPSMGVLAQGQVMECHVGFGDAAKSLAVGMHVGAVSFQNQTNGKGNTFRLVSLKVEGTPPPPPTQKLFLVIIYQEQDEHTYPRHVSQIIRTEEWEALRSDPPKDDDDFREWIFDPQSAPGPLKPWVNRVSEKGWPLPVFLLADDEGNLLYGPDMPASVDAAVDLVKDYLPKE